MNFKRKRKKENNVSYAILRHPRFASIRDNVETNENDGEKQ